MPAADFQMASIDYAAVSPVIVVVVAALVGVLVEAFVPRRARFVTQVVVAVVGLLGALAAVVTCARGSWVSTAAGAVVVDGPTLMIQGALLVLSLMSVLAMAERFDSTLPDAFTQSGSAAPGSHGESLALRLGATTTEVFPLTMLSVTGMLLFPAAGDLLVMFVALEVLSLPLYVLAGLARRRRLLSQEAALKYFLLGAFASAFFLFGAALLYGFAGSVRLADISRAVTSGVGMDGMLLMGAFFVLVGLLFKIGAVPFHAWTPDVYQGAPTPVTGFMAACTKMAAFGALLRLLYVGLAGDRWSLQPALWAVAILTMVVGSILTVTQTDMKRLLAYSSIAHAGFILVGVLAFDRSGVVGVVFYLIAYGFTTIAAFAIISLVRRGGSEATAISQWGGLARRHPVTAAVFSFLMLAFAGIPLTSGFTAKFAAFMPAVSHGGGMGTTLAVIGVLCSLVTAYAYLRVVGLMWFGERDGATAEVVMPSIATTVAVALGVTLTLVLGVFPTPLLDLAGRASTFLP
ncbi:NADH-quinone oxidoreductase subunit NuoN [Arsenicicoccus sp. oral taxon 190]|uniref:NADH-quinone oxidoreductase subunit NuoN n=1 Tax=Arsenicicoccus sp. oral taxon 190 TaxID=1658671 RepID=UPI00067A210D|nr:NADH-quinone oxidoreductase subunit NuoN [Arsenicicoccus sp. oral taxon 190]AKT52663.1 NADH:ubiquinone oxidoreductase subunit N [Arsenicicoccus sp. oral taxon 190]